MKRPRRAWSPEEDALLRARYADTRTADLAQQMGRSLSSTYQRAYQLGLVKSDAYLASPAAGRTNGRQGLRTRFPKGHVPANKGVKRGRGWAPGRMRDGQFRKGERSGIAAAHHRPIGSERLIDGYRYTKIADTPGVPWTRNWKQTHVLLWESAHGPLPSGHALVFKNRDRTDVRLGNLELLTRQELMARNTIHRLPEPVRQAAQLLGAVRRQINRRARDEEQDRRPA